MNEMTKATASDEAPAGMKLEDFGGDGIGVPGNGEDQAEHTGMVPHGQTALPSAEDPDSLERILGISVTLSVELGRVRLNINELLHLTHGSVVDLNRMAGSPMDILANGTLVAHGEVVVVNDRFGIRLTDVVSPADRIKGLS